MTDKFRNTKGQNEASVGNFQTQPL